MKDKAIRAIFVKHSEEKSPDLELFDTDAIIEEIAQTSQAEIQKQVTLGKIAELERAAGEIAFTTIRSLEDLEKTWAGYTHKRLAALQAELEAKT